MIRKITELILIIVLFTFASLVFYLLQSPIFIYITVIEIVILLFFILLRFRGKLNNYGSAIASVEQPTENNNEQFLKDLPSANPLQLSIIRSVLGLIIIGILWATIGGRESSHLIAYFSAAIAVIIVAFLISFLSVWFNYDKINNVIGILVLILFFVAAVYWLIWNGGAVPRH
jgi:hypothetical protein